MAEKIPVDLLREAILSQFGSQANLARKLNIYESQLSRSILSQAPGFMMRLKKAGLKLDGVNESLKDSDEQVRKINQLLNLRIEALEKIIKEKDKVIEHQNNLLEKYDKLLNKK